MGMAIVALFIVALIFAGEFFSKVKDYRQGKIMTVTKYRGPKKKRYRKLIVDIGPKVSYSIPLEEN